MRQSNEFGMSIRWYGDGPVSIVYLHGLAEAGAAFDPLLADGSLRTGGFTHIVPDLPGYGRSQWPEKPMVLEELASWLVEWIRSVPSKPVVVGHSMGGVLAVLMAEMAPDAVRSIVNIEGNVSLGDCTFSSRVSAVDLDNYVSGGWQPILEPLYADGASDAAKRLYYATFRFADPRSTHLHATDLVRISRAEDMAARMAGLLVRCTVVAGIPHGLDARSLELLDAAGVDTVRVEPAGHWVYADQPQVVAGVIAGLA